MILVTGASGLLGSHLCFHLLKSGKKVIALRRNGSRIENTREIFSFYDSVTLFNQLIWEEGDILDIFSVEEIIQKHKITEIYHCAALVSFELKDTERLLRMNSEGTANMVNAALQNNIQKFCHVSSIAALSQPDIPETITERVVWKSSPRHTNYAVSKYAAEREVWRGMEEGLNVIIVNPSLIIGPGCWNQSSGILLSNSRKGIRFYSPGGTGVVDVRDVTRAMVELMEKNCFGERFILNSENLSFKEILSLSQAGFGKKPPSVQVTKFLFRIGYRAERILCVFNGKTPKLSKEFLKSGFETTSFSNSKISKQLDMNFIPASESFCWACSHYPLSEKEVSDKKNQAAVHV
jgi:dihydroflavonol-4-reductase